jgi:hypothetical protein
MTASHTNNGRRPVRLLGIHASSVAYTLRDFLYRKGVPLEWIEPTTDEQARKLAQVSDLQDGRLRRFAGNRKSSSLEAATPLGRPPCISHGMPEKFIWQFVEMA